MRIVLVGARVGSRRAHAVLARAAVVVGIVAILVGPLSKSAAEHLLMVLQQEDRATIIGRTRAGTNASVTGARLPGGYTVTFTGANVEYSDAAPFFGIGVVPDVEVIPTPTDSRDGVDPELAMAISLATG
jgi:C-terminal processing protease CtpA/Prc